ncbi:MAG: hypothetical protein ACXVB0_08475 [Mucilaginibacter sp.]
MKNKALFALFCLGTLFSACSNHTYAPALFHQDIAYQPKPASYDSVKTASYISGGINFYTDPTWADMLVSSQFNYSRGHVFNNFNIAYGAFGILGDYEHGSSSSPAPNNFTDKFFGAVGTRASANLFTSYERMDFRYLGIEMAYSHEFGSYANFRQTVSTLPGYNVDTRTDLLTMGLTSEVIFHNIKNTNIQNGIRLFIGGTFGNDAFNEKYLSHRYIEPGIFNTIFPKVSYFLKVNHFFSTIEAGKQVFLRAGYSF